MISAEPKEIMSELTNRSDKQNDQYVLQRLEVLKNNPLPLLEFLQSVCLLLFCYLYNPQVKSGAVNAEY